MPRPRAVTPPIKLTTYVPADLRGRLDAHLWSNAEGRVPHGAYQGFLAMLLREYFEHKGLDLAPFLGSAPGEHIVTGPISTIAALQGHLMKGQTP